MAAVNKHFLSVVIPCYNEEAILSNNLNCIIQFLVSKNEKYSWEIVLVNDGSKDKTGIIADEFAGKFENVRVIHHPVNLNLGLAMQTGFKNSKGEIIIVLDIDLSYSVENIEKLSDKLIETSADIVVASPYMKGGKVIAVPFLRRVMSKFVNRFMRMAAQDKYFTFTGMVRAYKSEFIKSLNLKTRDYEINPEIMYKSMILRARIIEIPATLDWREQNKFAGKRTSSIRVFRGVFSGMMSGFIFRPYIFFFGVGIVLMGLALFELIWLLHNIIVDLPVAKSLISGGESPFSYSVFLQFKSHPQSFIIGGIALIASIQFLSLGFLSLQSKRYFEELFHLGTSLKKEKNNKSSNS